jgi:hypothetical protein
MTRIVLVCKIIGVQYIVDTHYQIIGSGPQDLQD